MRSLTLIYYKEDKYEKRIFVDINVHFIKCWYRKCLLRCCRSYRRGDLQALKRRKSLKKGLSRIRKIKIRQMGKIVRRKPKKVKKRQMIKALYPHLKFLQTVPWMTVICSATPYVTHE